MGCAQGVLLSPEQSAAEYIGMSPLACAVDEGELPELAHCFAYKRFRPRARVPVSRSEFYVVCEGDVDVSTIIPGGSKLVHVREFLCNKQPGAVLFLGTEQRHAMERHSQAGGRGRGRARHKNLMSMLDTTSARCGPLGAVLLRLAPQQLSALRARRPDLHWPVIDEMMRTGVVDHLRRLPLLRGVTESRLALLASMCHYRTFHVGDAVCEEGGKAEEFFVLVNGALVVRTGELELAELHAPACFGEVATLFDMPRSATVEARSRCLLLAVARQHFRNVVKLVPQLERGIVDMAKHNLLDKFVAVGVPFLSGLEPEDLAELQSLLDVVELTAPGVVFRENDIGDAFYIVAHGALQVKSARGNIALGPGQYFGELSLVLNTPRRATVEVLADSVLLHLSRDNFALFFANRVERLAEVKIKILGLDAALHDVLDHRVLRGIFMDHLAREHNDEHLRFYEHAAELREAFAALGADAVRPELERVIEQYVRAGAPDEVNISAPLRKAALERFEAGDCDPPDVLADVEREVFDVMERDSFARFLQSDAYREYLDQLGVYVDLDAQLSARTAPRRLSVAIRRNLAAFAGDSSEPAVDVGDEIMRSVRVGSRTASVSSSGSRRSGRSVSVSEIEAEFRLSSGSLRGSSGSLRGSSGSLGAESDEAGGEAGGEDEPEAQPGGEDPPETKDESEGEPLGASAAEDEHKAQPEAAEDAPSAEEPSETKDESEGQPEAEGEASGASAEPEAQSEAAEGAPSAEEPPETKDESEGQPEAEGEPSAGSAAEDEPEAQPEAAEDAPSAEEPPETKDESEGQPEAEGESSGASAAEDEPDAQPEAAEDAPSAEDPSETKDESEGEPEGAPAAEDEPDAQPAAAEDPSETKDETKDEPEGSPEDENEPEAQPAAAEDAPSAADPPETNDEAEGSPETDGS